MDTKQLAELLQAPFPASDIEWRVSRTVSTSKGPKSIVLAYVTNRAIMNRLDEVFGFGNWKNEYKEWRDKSVLCGISVKIDGEWITKWDGADETNYEATKGGFSSSMKRAAVQWGIGRYLYNLDENWVDIKDRGEHYINTKIKINNKDEWIKGYWDAPKLPAWALPHSENQEEHKKEEGVNAQTKQEQQATSPENKNEASDRQLDAISKLLKEVAEISEITKEEAYEALKFKMKTDVDMENFTKSQASNAIVILNGVKAEVKKQGA